MPHYDYRCRACGHQFEVFQSMADAKLTDCPECGGELKRLIGAGAGLIFKGSGFYITDYRSDSYKKAASKDGGSSSSSTSTTKKNGKSEKQSSSSTDKGSKSKSD